MGRIIDFKSYKVVNDLATSHICIDTENIACSANDLTNHLSLLESWLYGNYYIYTFNEYNNILSEALLSIKSFHEATLIIKSIKYICENVDCVFRNCFLKFVSEIGINSLHFILPELQKSYIGGLGNLQRPSTGRYKVPTSYKCIITRVKFQDPVSSFGTILKKNNIDEQDIYKIIQYQMVKHIQLKKYTHYSSQVQEDLCIDRECFEKLLNIRLEKRLGGLNND